MDPRVYDDKYKDKTNKQTNHEANKRRDHQISPEINLIFASWPVRDTPVKGGSHCWWFTHDHIRHLVVSSNSSIL
jgi:hypothetical protein